VPATARPEAKAPTNCKSVLNKSAKNSVTQGAFATDFQCNVWNVFCAQELRQATLTINEDIMAQTDAKSLSNSQNSETIATESTHTKAASGVMQFAQGALSAQVGRVSEILNNTADAIDQLLGGSDLPLPDGAKGFVTSTSGKLRDMADRTTEDEAGKLLEALQRTAAAHPATTAGFGAALGAALGLALAKLGGPAVSAATSKDQRESA
jgi:hypothetical protein